MKESKLIEILSTFSREELKAFEKFICSPYFTIGRDVTGLFFLLRKYHPKFEPLNVERRNIFAVLFPGEKYNEKKLKNISFDLARLAEQFLVHNSVRNNELLNERLLLEEYKERKKDKLFFGIMSSIEKKLDRLLIDEYKTFKYIEECSHDKAHYYFWKNDFDNVIKNELKYIEYFTLSFLVRFLKRLQNKTIVTGRYNKQFTNPLFDSMYESLDFEKLLGLLRKRKYSYLWLIEIYYNSYLCSDSSIESEVNFTRLKELFYENIDRFSIREKQGIFIDLTHYCAIQREEKNKAGYGRKQFEIYKKILEHYSLPALEKDIFNIVLYRSIMQLSIKLNEYDWLEDFMNKYTGMLKPEHRDNMKYLVKANLNFARKQYDMSLEYLSKIKYDLFLYKIDVKNLLLKNYYELNLFDQAYSLVDAYKHFLTNNKEYGELQQNYYRTFINLYLKLIKAKESGNKEAIDEFLKSLYSKNKIYSNSWLKEKAIELKNKFHLNKS